MPAKQLKCCCCPECTVQTLCGCTLKRLCITLEVEDTGDCGDDYTEPCCCTGQCIETQWDPVRKGWHGAFECGNLYVDFFYYFDIELNDQYEPTIVMKLRSDALGFPEGQERVFYHEEDFWCAIDNPDDEPPLSTITDAVLTGLNVACSQVTISTRSVFRIKPRCCTTCKCLPECLHAEISICGPGVPGFSEGILCWDDEKQSYEGEVTEANGTTHEVFVRIRPRCLFDQSQPLDDHGGRDVVLVDPYSGYGDPCDLPASGDCSAISPCVYEIEIPDSGYHKWFEEWEDFAGFELRGEKCDIFGSQMNVPGVGVMPGDRFTTGNVFRDAACERIDEPTTNYVCDCKTYSSSPVLPPSLQPGGSIALVDGSSAPVLIKNCPDGTCDECRDWWVLCERNVELPASVYPPADACCGYYWGVGSLGVALLLWCDGQDWQCEQYCVTGEEPNQVYTHKGAVTIDVICIPGTRPHLTANIPECCGRCHGCDPCEFLTSYNIEVYRNGSLVGSGTLPFTSSGGGGGGCVTLGLTGGDQMSIELNLTTCTARIGCNGIPCTTFNCLATKTLTINSCDPLDITITFTGGFFNACAACANGAYEVHIYE